MKMILSQKTVFLTGGGGFIGSHLVKKLVKEGYTVHLLWRKNGSTYRLEEIKQDVQFHIIDLLDTQTLEKLLKKIKPAYIIHLATYSQYRDQDNAFAIVQTSVLGTLSLLLASKDTSFVRFINTGSSSEYGKSKIPMQEDEFLQPVSFYAAAKVSATYLCDVFAKTYNKDVITVRPFSVYGPMEDESRFIPTIIQSLIQGKSINIAPGINRRDFVYIDDVVNFYMKLLNSTKKYKHTVFNIGTGKEYSNDEVVKTLFAITKKKVLVNKGQFEKRIWDSVHWVADTKRSKNEINWKAKYSLEQGLKNTYRYYAKRTREK